MKLFDKFKNKEKEQDLFMIVGLGNPGSKYNMTKHNVGFWVIDKLAEKYGIEVKQFKNKALVGFGKIRERKVMLVKPQTFMNLSGDSVRELVNFYKIPQDRFVVIFDDTSLPIGSVRIREKGSAGGHNGIKSIIAQMGTDSFWRIKTGIGEKPNGWDLADYVLAPFGKDEIPLIEQGTDKAAAAVEIILEKGIADAMNRINQKPKTAKTENKKEQKAPENISAEADAEVKE